MNLKQFLPVLQWLPGYSKKDLTGDLAAGLTVGVMLIPQGMAYAMIAGLPPIYGLYASTVPLILYAIFGTSRQLAVGPVAMVSLLTAAGVGLLAEQGTETYIALAISLALLVGLIQFGLGVFRLGFLVNFLSHPVISGFTSAAALIIGLSQLKHLLGVDIPRTHHVHEILIHAVQQFEHINWITFGIGLAGIALIILGKRIHPAMPSQLLAVVFGILTVWGLGLDSYGVKIVSDVPQGLPAFGVPRLDTATIEALLPAALAISLVGFMESIAVAKAIQARHKNYKVDPNQELIALGLANIGGSFFKAYPVTGGFSRTAVNDQAGARTGMASIISALFIMLTLLYLTPLFYYLPKAILASVIMVAVFGLIDYKEAIHLWTANRTDFALLLVTFFATLTLGIEQGIGVGVVLSLAMVIFRTTRPHMARLGRIPGTRVYKNIERFDHLEVPDDLLIVRFDAQLYFANVNHFRDTIEQWAEAMGGKLKAIILDAESINNIDSTGVHTLLDLIEEFRAQGIDFYVVGLKGPVRDALARAHALDKIGIDHLYVTVQDAVDAARGQTPRNLEKKAPVTTQTSA